MTKCQLAIAKLTPDCYWVTADHLNAIMITDKAASASETPKSRLPTAPQQTPQDSIEESYRACEGLS